MADLERAAPQLHAGARPLAVRRAAATPAAGAAEAALAAELEGMREAQERLARERAAELARGSRPRPRSRSRRRSPCSYLGSFRPRRKAHGGFSDGKSIFITLEGEVLEGKFIVAHIGYESVDIRFVNFPEVPAKRVGVTPRRQGQVGGNPG